MNRNEAKTHIEIKLKAKAKTDEILSTGPGQTGEKLDFNATIVIAINCILYKRGIEKHCQPLIW